MHIILGPIKVLLYPEVWIFIGLSVGCLISWTTRCPRSIRFILCLLLVLYYGFTTRPLAQALVQPLETYYRPPAAIPLQQDAIVLFANTFPTLPPFTERPTIVGTRNADLLICGLIYVQARSAPTIVLAEGTPGVFPRHVTGTGVLREWAVLLGYPREAIITDDQAVATHERARAIKQRLGARNRIVLIDAAIHLARSAAAFQKAGFTVTPIPCDYYNMSSHPWSFFDFVPYAGNLAANNEAVYEYIGLLTYWLRGLI
jgi:uncharacterized SAM-binding protein YcdF (DUF218 family)